MQHHDALYRTIYRIVGSQQEAEDLLQEAFFKLYEHWEQIEPGKHKPWLFQVATRLGLNALRSEKRRHHWQNEATRQEHCTDAPQTSKDPVAVLSVRKALAEMPERQARILMLYMSGLDHAELAQALDVKKTSISQLLFRAKKIFSDLFSKT